jgi:hypothetical protein
MNAKSSLNLSLRSFEATTSLQVQIPALTSSDNKEIDRQDKSPDSLLENIEADANNVRQYIEEWKNAHMVYESTQSVSAAHLSGFL